MIIADAHIPCSSVFIRSKRPSCIIHRCCSAPSLIKLPLPHRCTSPTALTKRIAIASHLVGDPETISASVSLMPLRKRETGTAVRPLGDAQPTRQPLRPFHSSSRPRYRTRQVRLILGSLSCEYLPTYLGILCRGGMSVPTVGRLFPCPPGRPTMIPSLGLKRSEHEIPSPATSASLSFFTICAIHPSGNLAADGWQLHVCTNTGRMLAATIH
ncbi:hypothetical protein LX32DRAFT_54015 [Colletotrichum zoysiae]|uniref:Uncharacterized protein n=1 Tax=Colletotrichum zoysiae TaxID=1216348 RepID=A0AAD9HCB6_9PEZI|nr:hypothetical protein LX32DRAFT_54015 [Colletotrichum zoysiae]